MITLVITQKGGAGETVDGFYNVPEEKIPAIKQALVDGGKALIFTASGNKKHFGFFRTATITAVQTLQKPYIQVPNFDDIEIIDDPEAANIFTPARFPAAVKEVLAEVMEELNKPEEEAKIGE